MRHVEMIVDRAVAEGRLSEAAAQHLRRFDDDAADAIRTMVDASPIGARAADERGRFLCEARALLLAEGKSLDEITADDLIRAGNEVAIKLGFPHPAVQHPSAVEDPKDTQARINEMETELRNKIHTRAEEILRRQNKGTGYTADEYLVAAEQARQELAAAHSAVSG